MEFKSTITWFW